MKSEPSGSEGGRPAAHVIGAPIEEPSNASSTQPLCQHADAAPYRGLSSDDVDIQMHFLDSMHHATHWLKEHELQRSKKPLGSRLCSIKSGHFLPLLEQWSSTRAVSGTLLGACENIPEDHEVSNIANHCIPQHNLHAFQLQQFWQELDSFTEPLATADLYFVGVESEEQIPACNCSKLCTMVRYPYQHDEIFHLWVCDFRTCMFSEFFNITDSFGQVVNTDADPEMAHAIELFNHDDLSVSPRLFDSSGDLMEKTAFGYLTLEELKKNLANKIFGYFKARCEENFGIQTLPNQNFGSKFDENTEFDSAKI